MHFDVVFISYDELNADENWEKLTDLIPYAIRIDGVKGIPNAHIEAAKQVSTSHFFCVDADNVVDNNFDFENVVDFHQNDRRVHVWGCNNPVNGLQYGYGGVKLFPTDHVEHIKEYSVDFCTSAAAASSGFKSHKEIASTTHFNTTPFNAWKSGFRECTKLSSAVIDNQKNEETLARLKIWTSVGMDVDFGDYAIAGARMGVMHGSCNSNKLIEREVEELNIINDFSVCREYYDLQLNHNDIMSNIQSCGEEMLDMFDIETALFTAEQSEFIKKVMYKI